MRTSNTRGNGRALLLLSTLLKTFTLSESFATCSHHARPLTARCPSRLHSPYTSGLPVSPGLLSEPEHHDVSWEDLVSAPADVASLRKDYISTTDIMLMTATLSFTVMAFAYLVHASGAGAWRYYMAGGVCAAASHAIPTPIDVIKTRQQLEPDLQELTVYQAAREIIKRDGVNSLLTGLGPTVWGYLAEGAVKFGVYEVLKAPIIRMLTSFAIESRILAYVLAGAVSGFAASIMLCPMEALRIRMVAEPDFAPSGSTKRGMIKMLKIEGVTGLAKGMKPMAYKQVPYTVTKNVSFDVLTRGAYSLLRAQGFQTGASVKFLVPGLCAMVASVLSCITSQPGDLLLSLVNAHEGERRTRDILKDVVRSRGIGGLFVGIRARFLHVGIIVTLQLLIYDFVKRLCGIGPTGCV